MLEGKKGTTTTEYQCRDIIYGANGYIETYYNDDGYCFDSLVEIPGMQLMGKNGMAVVFAIFLIYLFLGIAIIAD